MSVKLFKDPIYGYINIDTDIVINIIDSPNFQRLRNIRQTSYSPLYHAAVQNRFLHSIGVFFLAKKAIEALNPSLTEAFGEGNFEAQKKVVETFTLACLLHDVGHAPFSHTGEDFYLTDFDPVTKVSKIYNLLNEYVDDESFANDAKNRYAKPANPHEIMSAIVSLKEFSEYIPSDYRAFFARCITGYKYSECPIDDERQILNCFIELLNSTTIDLDRLDYIIRDSFSTGFQNVAIDFNRLLSGLRFCKNKKKDYKLAFHKSALSIIENVIYAHDSERKWIQNHPIILYEHFLVQYMIKTAEKYFSHLSNKKLFCLESLSLKGKTFGEKSISLLSDEDIIYTIKNDCRDSLSAEFFSRKDRRHAIWKSEAEYRLLFKKILEDGHLDLLEANFQDLEKFLSNNYGFPIIDDILIEYCNSLKDTLAKNELPQKEIDDRNVYINNLLRWINCLKSFANDNDIPFSYVIFCTSQFKSGFMKKDLELLLIKFFDDCAPSHIKDVSSILKSVESRENFFYIFSFRNAELPKKIDPEKFVRHLHQELLKSIE